MAEPMSAERLAEIRAREQATTKGPWITNVPIRLAGGSVTFIVESTCTEEDIASVNVYQGPARAPAENGAARAEAKADAEFIAHARTDVPDLLAEVDRLDFELAIRMQSLATAETNLRLLGGPGALARRKETEYARDHLAGLVKRVRDLHGRPRTDRPDSGCVQCGIVWPCPTFLAVDGEGGGTGE